MRASALSICPTPIAAPTLSLPNSSLFALGYSTLFFKSLIVISPSNLPSSLTTGSFSTLFVLKICSASSRVVPFFTVIKGIFVITEETGLLNSSSKRKSLLVKIPISFLFSSTTGTPEILYSLIISKASLILASGRTETGSMMIPLSLFFTL